MTWCYLWWSMSYTVHKLIFSYGLFIVSGCDLVCGVLCTWRGLCQVMWADRTNCYIRLSGTHWENPSEWKRGCGAIWWLDVWYSAVYRILFWLWGLLLSNAECYTKLTQIPKMGIWSVYAVWCVGLWLYGWIDWLCWTLGLILWSALTW